MKIHSIRNPRNFFRKRKGPLPFYIRYLYQMGALRPRSSSPRRTHFLLREDIRHLDRILDEFKLIRSKRLDHYQDLLDYRGNIQEQIEHLLSERKNLKMQKHSSENPEIQDDLILQSKQISQQLRQCRKELKLCDGIQTRSLEMANKLEQIRKEATVIPTKEKEDVEHDQRR